MANERYIYTKERIIRNNGKEWSSTALEFFLTEEGEAYLRGIWGKTSRAEICRTLDVHNSTLMRFAWRLGLPYVVKGKMLTEEDFEQRKAKKAEQIKRYYEEHKEELSEKSRLRSERKRREMGIPARRPPTAEEKRERKRRANRRYTQKKKAEQTPEEKRARQLKINEANRKWRRKKSIAEGRRQYRHFNSKEEREAVYREERRKKRETPVLTPEEREKNRKEKKRAYMCEYYKNHTQEAKAWRDAHREEINARRRKRYAEVEKPSKRRARESKYANEEEKRLARNERSRLRMAKKRAEQKAKEPKAQVTEVKLVKRSRRNKVLTEADKQIILDNYGKRSNKTIADAIGVSGDVFNTFLDMLGLKDREAKVTRDHSDERFRLTITRNHRVVTTVYLRSEDKADKYRKYYGDSYEYNLTAI